MLQMVIFDLDGEGRSVNAQKVKLLDSGQTYLTEAIKED
jgi:hypothetical protein